MINKKAAYVDFSEEKYKSLSDDEIQLLKQVNSKVNGRSIKNCKKHGLHEPALVKFLGTREIYLGCLKCLEEKHAK